MVNQANAKPTGPRPWFQVPSNSTASVRLFCFPYAGGSSVIFRPWSKELPREIEVVPALLPGRELRVRERAYKLVEPMVEALAREIAPYLDKPFAFLGHSMGGIISFELARRLRSERGVEPVHVFISGRRSPQESRRDPYIHDLPDAEFARELEQLNGTPKEVLEHKELMELLIPMLRADFSVCHTYTYVPSEPLRCPITVLGGTRDQEAPPHELDLWCKETTGDCNIQILEGDHFFIHQLQAEVLRTIQVALRTHLQPL